MKRVSAAGVFVVCLGLTAACGGGNNDETQIAEREPEVSGRDENRPVPITQTGCLTASGDRFVLTALESGSAPARGGQQQQGGANAGAQGQATTESYQLIGDAEELRQLVGKQVRVNGEAEPAKVAEVRESTPPTDASGATGTTGQAQPAKPGEPQVSTSTQTRLEVTQLRVQSITATGESCNPARPN